MKMHIYKDTEGITSSAAALFSACILEKPGCILGLATGSTPVAIYTRLGELCRAGILDFSGVKTYNLDEYVGLDREHEQSYYRFMKENLFQHVNIDMANVHVLCGVASDLTQECRDYERAIDEAGGIDLQILGIGHNGHIAFNEPADAFSNVTQIVDLTPSTIEANTRFFDCSADVPRQALSTGIGTIMRARKIVMVCTGEGKARAVYDMVRGPVTPKCPASMLQFHPNVTVILDEAAASML